MPLTREISCGRTEEQLKRHTSLSDSVKAPVEDEQTQEGLHLGKCLLFVFKNEQEKRPVLQLYWLHSPINILGQALETHPALFTFMDGLDHACEGPACSGVRKDWP